MLITFPNYAMEIHEIAWNRALRMTITMERIKRLLEKAKPNRKR
jgi:hypothetical protein